MWPELFKIGSFGMPTYGPVIAVGFLVGISLASRLARNGESGLDQERVSNLGVVLLLSAIVGAKAFMFIDEWSYYSANPARFFSLSALRSGGVFYGGLLAAIGVAYYYTRRHRLPWLATADVLAPGLAVGHAIGRLGCFAAGCCWGRETEVAWAVTFSNPIAHSVTGVPLHLALHPTQLYEAAGTAIIGVFLLWQYGRPHAAGTILGSYLVFYSLFRFGVEFFRDEGARTLVIGGAVSTTQCVAIGLAIAGVWLLRTAPQRSRPLAASPPIKARYSRRSATGVRKP